MTVPDGQSSVTSGPIFSSGTQVSVDGFLTVTATTVAWDADAQTVTMTDDMSTTLTLTETGPAVRSKAILEMYCKNNLPFDFRCTKLVACTLFHLV